MIQAWKTELERNVFAAGQGFSVVNGLEVENACLVCFGTDRECRVFPDDKTGTS